MTNTDSGFGLDRQVATSNSAPMQSADALPGIDKAKIKESGIEKRSEKILLYNTRSYFWIAFFFTMIPVVYMTWKNTRYYSDDLKKRLRKFAISYIIVYILIILFGGNVISLADNIVYRVMIWLAIIMPYFYYTNKNEYPVYKAMLDNKIARARASVAPIVIGLMIYAVIITPIIVQFIARSLDQTVYPL